MNSLRQNFPETFRALMDIRFQRFITVEMVSVFYTLLLIGLGVGALKLVVDGFSVHWSNGLVHLLIIAPTFFLVGAVIVRCVLEFVLAVFQIAAGVEEIADLPRSMPKLESVKGVLKPILSRMSGGDAEKENDAVDDDDAGKSEA